MKTYLETKENWSFNWWTALEYMDNNPASKKQWNQLEMLASKWVTCAVGNQCSVIPREVQGCPKDSILESLGQKFYWDIESKDVTSAMFTLLMIEDRSSELIAQMRVDKTKPF